MSGEAGREVIFEVTRIGDAQRVAAIDTATGVEVVVQAPASAALADVRALALRKLERALKAESENTSPPPPRPGKLV
ncbi:MAG: serine hydroxymethyltransferase [Phycisphaerales bacterium]|nr:serine hydroxymethyltransferase [Hyphomonadaceae bacterium]